MSEKLTAEQIVGIVKKLVGQTDWWGETYKDEESLENLEVYGDVICLLVCDLVEKHITSHNRCEYSIKKLNAKYGLWIKRVNSVIEDSVNEIKKENINDKNN